MENPGMVFKIVVELPFVIGALHDSDTTVLLIET